MWSPGFQLPDYPNRVLWNEFDIKKCVYWITFNKYQRICLQFPDELLKYSADIALTIEKEVSEKVYILGDTTFGSCCVDYVAAKHICADSLIHFGRACLTSHEELPTLYVFPKLPLDVQTACSTIINSSSYFTVVLYDIGFSHLIDELIGDFAIVRNRVRVSRLATPQQNADVVKYSPNDVVIKKFGRIFSIPNGVNLSDIMFVYITDRRYEMNLENFVLNYRETPFYRYDSDSPGHLEVTAVPDIVKRKLFLVQKIKESKRIGILVSTLATDRFMEAIERIKTLCRLRKKKSYIISVGKINPAKLANFPEISIFVMVGCPETDIPTDKNYYQPIVSMMEIEMALNDNNVSWESTVKDFREFLPGGHAYKEIDEHLMQVECEADVSLTSSNRLVSSSVVNCDVTENGDSAVASRDPLTVSRNIGDGGLSSRSWRGLQLNIGDTPVEKASIGRTGTPSSGYQHPSSSNLS